MRKLLSYLGGREWLLLGLFGILTYGQTIFILKVPEYMQGITDLMQARGWDLQALVDPALSMLACTLATIVCSVGAGYFLAVISATVVQRMRSDLFGKVMSFSLQEMGRFPASSLITRCTADVERVRDFLTAGVSSIVEGVLMMVMAIVKMEAYHAWANAVVTVALALAVVTIVLFVLAVSRTNEAQRLVDVVNRLTKEHLAGLRVVHAYNGYDYQRTRFVRANDGLMRQSVASFRLTGAVTPVYNLCLNALTLIIYLIGAYAIYGLAGTAEQQRMFSDMVVFSSYGIEAFSAIAMLVMLLSSLPQMVVSLRRVNEVTTTEVAISDGAEAAGVPGKEGTIEFRDVSFAYPGAEAMALSHITFAVEQGQTLAIIGGTGSGKTTLLNLVMRLYDVTEGAVYVDGRDVRSYQLGALRDRLGYVPQRSFLFAGTIAGNIDYGHKSGFENTLAEIRRAAEVGQSREFIERQQAGYEARVEEGGANFSGGQRQRLTISRAVCRDPEIYLFDDSFSALDLKTDATLRARLRESAQGATQVIVGQRIGAVKEADRVIVLDEGRVVGQGTHEELLERCDAYREIALTQHVVEGA